MAAQAKVPAGSECDWELEWERKWTPPLALAHTHDTILRTLSLRRTARVDSALLDRPGRLDCLVLGQTAGLQCRGRCCSVVVRFWKSIACLSGMLIDPVTHAGVYVVVVDVVAAAHCSIPAQGAAAVFQDRSWPTSRCCCAICVEVLS